MSIAGRLLFEFDHSFVRDLDGLFEPWQAAPAPAPQLLILNGPLADELGLDAEALRTVEGVALLVGNAIAEGSTPVAQAYSGHQFGGFSPRLGDGRALLLGELLDADGQRHDVHLKGSGRTPFSRGGDGKAAVGPMLREYIVSEAMHALGIPTTRSLAVVATGERIARDTGMLPGAVLVRVASSHIRVGTFQYAAQQDDPTLVRRLAAHAIARHHPAAADAPNPYVAFLESVIEAQASLVASWMLVGFIHGVMNTDNMTISGETIDYGPCAFMDAFDPATVFSSIDHAGRYAFGNQPQIAQWNLARLAEPLLSLLDPDPDTAVSVATELLQTYPARFRGRWRDGMRAKLGLTELLDGDSELIDGLLSIMHTQTVDFTACFRQLSRFLRGDTRVRSLFSDPGVFDEWAARWTARLATDGLEPAVVAAGMDRVNPIYIPRNQQLEAALTAASDGDGDGDLGLFQQLLDVVSEPFVERPGLEGYAVAGPAGPGLYQTFCGT